MSTHREFRINSAVSLPKNFTLLMISLACVVLLIGVVVSLQYRVEEVPLCNGWTQKQIDAALKGKDNVEVYYVDCKNQKQGKVKQRKRVLV